MQLSPKPFGANLLAHAAGSPVGCEHAMRILKRIGNVIEGLVFIVLSLCLQSIFLILLTMAVLVSLSALGLKLESDVWQWMIFSLLLLTINAIACWEYFYKRRAQVQLGKLHRSFS
jgi:hypothetical protein